MPSDPADNARKNWAIAGQVTGLFADRATAERACRALGDRGYRQDAIKLLMSDRTRTREFSDFEAGRHAASFDPRARTCPASVSVAVCVEGAPSAAAVCGVPARRTPLADMLAGSGISNERIAEYEAAMKAGAILMRVITRSTAEAQLIETEWRRSYRAEKVHS